MLPASKFCIPVRGLTASNGGTQIVGYVDRKGYDFCSIDTYMTTVDAVGNHPTTFKLGHSDDTYVTNAADLTDFVGSTATSTSSGWVIPDFSTTTATDNTVKMNVDCRAMKRYLHLEIVPVTTQTCWSFANLFRGKEMPVSTTEVNVLAVVNGTV